MKIVCAILLLSAVNAFAQLGTTIIRKTSGGAATTNAGCVFIHFRLQGGASGASIGNSGNLAFINMDLSIPSDYFGGSGQRLPAIRYSTNGGSIVIVEVK